ncbi:MAG: hypothetical protein A2026_22030 [Deltaproteobacteria bacterium RBG_19FT_COMBO_46_12]|nr:MAG: hypothetical protein A2026_22030 [Deltaproteobacteria bacterium RBG_19FT_COMBO_46_12]
MPEEIRSTKSLPSPKRFRAGKRISKQFRMTQIKNMKNFGDLRLEFGICFGFRYSNFGFFNSVQKNSIKSI